MAVVVVVGAHSTTHSRNPKAQSRLASSRLCLRLSSQQVRADAVCLMGPGPSLYADLAGSFPILDWGVSGYLYELGREVGCPVPGGCV